MNKDANLAVVGGGISGLSAAYWLKQAGFKVTVFEKTTHIGGSIHTERTDDFVIDLGPNSTLETSEVLKDLIKELGLEDQKVYGNQASNKRYILKRGRLVPLPMSPLAFIKTSLFSLQAKLRLLKEPFIKATNEDDISLADFVRYRLGDEFLDYAINPFVAGVYAGNPETLSTAAAFPKLYALEQKYGSLIKGAIRGARERKRRKEVAKDRAKLFSFKNGMEVFPKALADHLKDEIKMGSSVKSITHDKQGFHLSVEQQDNEQVYRFDKVVFAVPAFALGQMIGSLDASSADVIKKVKYPPVGVITLAFKKEKVGRVLDGFGFLVPEKESKKILGSIWSSTIFPNRAPENYALLTTFVGGTRQPEVASLDDEQLVSTVIDELSAVLDLRGEPDMVKIKRWPLAIPQYTLGYKAVQQCYDQLERSFPGLYIAGNTRMGISVGDSVLSAYHVIQKIKGKV